jgi:pantetheine-phosphate adenylyltransferase
MKTKEKNGDECIMVRNVKNKKMRLLYPGTFDPFTLGHADMVKRALHFCDSIVIAVGVNGRKSPLFSVEVRVDAIRRYYAEDKRVSVIKYDGFTVNVMRDVKADAILRGVRSVTDFEEERNMAEINRALDGVETIFLVASSAFQHVSSSMVKELIKYGRSVDEFVIDTFPKR